MERAEVLRGHLITNTIIYFILVILVWEHVVLERWVSGAPVCVGMHVHGGWWWPRSWSHRLSLPGHTALTLWARQSVVSCRAPRPGLSLKESLALKGRRWSLLCCHHTARRLAANQISLLRECESKWHVIWMLMKISVAPGFRFYPESCHLEDIIFSLSFWFEFSSLHTM